MERELKKITLEDKPLFDGYLQRENVQTSELTFTNLFVWREFYDFRHTMLRDCLVVVACGAEGSFALPPLGLEFSTAPDAVLAGLAGLFSRQGLSTRIERADIKVCNELKKLGIPFQAEHDRANDDYLYRTKDLRDLTGKKYDGKRNHIRRLMNEHTVEYQHISAEDLSQAENIISAWFSKRSEAAEDMPEWRACQELLKNYAILDCKGLLMLVDGEPSAVTFGEKLNENTAVVHFEKAVRYENGAYPAICRGFAQEWGDTTFINREQDLGLPGLRASKLSWHPARIEEKYKISFPTA